MKSKELVRNMLNVQMPLFYQRDYITLMPPVLQL
jgi:hypothetical protein